MGHDLTVQEDKGMWIDSGSRGNQVDAEGYKQNHPEQKLFHFLPLKFKIYQCYSYLF